MIKLIENYKLGNRIYTFGCESDGHNFTLRIELANKQEILEKEGRTATVRNLHTGEKREIKTYNGDNLEGVYYYSKFEPMLRGMANRMQIATIEYLCSTNGSLSGLIQEMKRINTTLTKILETVKFGD